MRPGLTAGALGPSIVSLNTNRGDFTPNNYISTNTPLRPPPPPPPPPPASRVEGSSLTTSLCYQDLRIFCNQLAYGRLVIRRAAEMENSRFVIVRTK